MLTIVENVHIYQPADWGRGDVAICGTKIIDVGSELHRCYPTAQKYAGDGLLAFPGYIDQHVHVTGGGGEGGFKTRVPELGLESIIRAGVTTLVGVLGTDGITRSVENLLAKTKALNQEGITAYCLTGSYEYPTVTLTGSIKKDIAFIGEILGVKVAISDHRSSQMSKDELIRLVSEVRLGALLGGKPGIVTIHVGAGKNGLGLVFDALRDSDLPVWHFRPTHVGKLGQQAVDLAKMGGCLDFTAGINPRQTAAQIVGAINKGAPLGRITLSSDANGSLPKWNEKNELIGITAAPMDSLHGVIRTLIAEKKMAVSDAISLVTANAAWALGLEESKGALRPGCDADLILLDRNFAIETVFARGQLLMDKKELKVKGTFA
ncbi:MAG TPA: beta-aspartyl-peptidase [Firmicutes bacterium]|nr:beta-aspartyl-peptidase [Bacillota bacterium]